MSPKRNLSKCVGNTNDATGCSSSRGRPCGCDAWKGIAQHLPGVQNVVADAESRTMTDRSDWQLNPAIFNRITYLFGPIEMDLFSSRLTAQCPEFSAGGQIPNKCCCRTGHKSVGYANPPWNLIGRVLPKVQMDKARIALVVPVWKTQPW